MWRARTIGACVDCPRRHVSHVGFCGDLRSSCRGPEVLGDAVVAELRVMELMQIVRILFEYRHLGGRDLLVIVGVIWRVLRLIVVLQRYRAGVAISECGGCWTMNGLLVIEGGVV